MLIPMTEQPRAPLPETLGQMIRRLRLRKGWSQAALAQEVGTSREYISQIESGQRKWPERFIAPLAVALNVPQSLLGRAAGRIISDEGAETHIRTAPATAVLSRAEPSDIPLDDPFYDLMMLDYQHLTPSGRRFLAEQAKRLRQMQDDIRREAEGHNEPNR